MHEYAICYRQNGDNRSFTVPGREYDEAKRLARMVARETSEPVEILIRNFDDGTETAVWNSREDRYI